MAKTYRLDLTGGQLRTVHDALNVLTNDPDWVDYFGGRDWQMLCNAAEKIGDAWRAAAKAESTPAFPPSDKEHP